MSQCELSPHFYGLFPLLLHWLQKEAVLGMLRSKLQEEGLRTYLLAYGRFYSSLSIAQLCDMFELPERKVSRQPLQMPHWPSPVCAHLPALAMLGAGACNCEPANCR